jgi:hypothetical protein
VTEFEASALVAEGVGKCRWDAVSVGSMDAEPVLVCRRVLEPRSLVTDKAIDMLPSETVPLHDMVRDAVGERSVAAEYEDVGVPAEIVAECEADGRSCVVLRVPRLTVSLCVVVPSSVRDTVDDGAANDDVRDSVPEHEPVEVIEALAVRETEADGESPPPPPPPRPLCSRVPLKLLVCVTDRLPSSRE